MSQPPKFPVLREEVWGEKSRKKLFGVKKSFVKEFENMHMFTAGAHVSVLFNRWGSK